MSTKSIVIVVSIVLFSFLAVLVLYALSDIPLSDSQNFKRVFGPTSVQRMNVLKLDGNSYYIAGVTETQVFLGDKRDSLKLLITDTQLHSPQHVQLTITPDIKLNMTGQENLRLKKSFIEIDSPFFFIKDGGLPGIFKGQLQRWTASRILDRQNFFEQAVPVTPNLFAMQAIVTKADTKTHQHILYTMLEGASKPKFNSSILEGDVDNFFSTMGILRYSKKLNLLVYTYSYRNEYIVLDTGLNLQNKGKTIDNTEHSQIKPVETSEGNFSLASPPAIVNRNAQIYENLLFIQSNIKATNESRNFFKKTSAIDVYNLKTLEYKFSFYIPDHENDKMITFRVAGNRVIALYDHHVASYLLKFTEDTLPL